MSPTLGTFRVWRVISAAAFIAAALRISLPFGPFGRRLPTPSPVRQRHRLGPWHTTHDQRPRSPTRVALPTGKLRHNSNVEGVHPMKRVLAGLAGAVALAGVSSMSIAQAPEKGERPAAKRDAKQPRAAPAPRAARQADKPAARAAPAPRAARQADRPAARAAPARRAARQADRPAARAPSKLPAAAQRSRPQPPAAAQAGPRQPDERKRAQQSQPVDRQIDQQSRQAQDKRAQDQVRQRRPSPPQQRLAQSKSRRTSVAQTSAPRVTRAHSPPPLVSTPPTSSGARSTEGYSGRARWSALPAIG